MDCRKRAVYSALHGLGPTSNNNCEAVRKQKKGSKLWLLPWLQEAAQAIYVHKLHCARRRQQEAVMETSGLGQEVVERKWGLQHHFHIRFGHVDQIVDEIFETWVQIRGQLKKIIHLQSLSQ